MLSELLTSLFFKKERQPLYLCCSLIGLLLSGQSQIQISSSLQPEKLLKKLRFCLNSRNVFKKENTDSK